MQVREVGRCAVAADAACMCMCMQIREVLERFLNDDDDMHRLHLTGNEICRQASIIAAQAAQVAAAADDDVSDVLRCTMMRCDVGAAPSGSPHPVALFLHAAVPVCVCACHSIGAPARRVKWS